MPTYNFTQFLGLSGQDQSSVSTSIINLNALNFGQRDLNLFIESMEIISRIEKERNTRRKIRRAQKIQHARMTQLKKERSASPTPSAEMTTDEPVLHLEAKCIPYAVSDFLTVQKSNNQESNPGLPEYYICDNETKGNGLLSARSSITYCSCDGIFSLDFEITK
ncbi:uncharacterized protein LOC108111544 [Drosophila eugracilis]|uniref:uncharacterized protein LOC108111544 n=1 Tax=Drosophila eugracilis TaxID=29029 RepID=UPI001BD9F95A|nr:uncharacterized protein LOC108111544 [Drosophila eugracilis]